MIKNKDKLELEGKTIIITGGTTGIGLAISKKCLEMGANIISMSRSNHDHNIHSKQFKVLNGNICFINDIYKLFSFATETFGEIDAFIANAAASQLKDLLDVNENDVNLLIDTNIKGTFYSLQAASKFICDNGRIITISSIAANRTGAKAALYAATKSAQISLTQAFADELANKNITVNAILPGITDTNLLTNLGITKDDKIQMAKNIPLMRLADPDEIANAAIFLLSPLANYITGQTIIVDGGISSIWK